MVCSKKIPFFLYNPQMRAGAATAPMAKIAPETPRVLRVRKEKRNPQYTADSKRNHLSFGQSEHELLLDVI